MRLIPLLVTLALATALAPATAAAAEPDPGDLSGGELRAGECVVRWSWFWPGETLGVECAHDGETLVAFSHGTCALGHYTYVQVGRASAYLPCEAPLLS